MNSVIRLTKSVLAVGAFLFLTGMSSCHREGPVEKAGHKVDEAVDNIKEGQSPFHKKGIAEKAGEQIDNATGAHR